jgi:RNA polymerase sigma-70 factor (ECF subfamily)
MAQVGELIRRLPPADMQVILLWLEGETAAAIAEITGFSPGAVNVRVHRIKALIASHFHLTDEPEPNR